MNRCLNAFKLMRVIMRVNLAATRMNEISLPLMKCMSIEGTVRLCTHAHRIRNRVRHSFYSLLASPTEKSWEYFKMNCCSRSCSWIPNRMNSRLEFWVVSYSIQKPLNLFSIHRNASSHRYCLPRHANCHPLSDRIIIGKLIKIHQFPT